MSRLYIGNLSWETTEVMLREALAKDGRTVTAVKIKIDAQTGKSRGFAFVDMGSREEAEAAIGALNGTSLGGRTIKVNLAKELQTRRSEDNDYGSGGFRGRGQGRRY